MTSAIANSGGDARPAHARGRLPLRLPGDRERPRGGPRLPEGERQERASASTAAAPATPPSTPSRLCTATACTWWAASSSATPDDTRESIEANLDFARRYVDWPYIQHPTPYPRTPMTRDLRDRGLIVNERVEEYDGTTAVVRSEHLSADEIEFLRWRRGALDEGPPLPRRPRSADPASSCATAAPCSPTPSAAAPGAPGWAWSPSARRSTAIAPSGGWSATRSSRAHRCVVQTAIRSGPPPSALPTRLGRWAIRSAALRPGRRRPRLAPAEGA